MNFSHILKSVNSNFNLAARSRKFEQDKTDHGIKFRPSHIFSLFFSQNETKSESWPVKDLVSVMPE